MRNKVKSAVALCEGGFKKISIISLALLFIVGLIFSTQVKAVDDSTGLIISPPLKENSANPGDSLSDVIKITNPTDSTLEVAITVQDFKAQGEEGAQIFIDPGENITGFSMASWIEVEKNFTLKSQETKEIEYSVKVPDNAEAGGHYGVIFFTPSKTSSDVLEGSGAVVVPKVGSLILVNVSGNVVYSAEIEEFSTAKSIYLNNKNIIDFISRVQNTGTSHIKPQGNIVVKNSLGNTVTTLAVNEKSGNILPDSIRKFENEWDKKYGFGYYKAELALTYGEGKTITDSLSFWVFPWMETVGGIIVLIFLIWLARHISWKKNRID